MKYLLISAYIFFQNITTNGQSVIKTMLRLPDTGQINSYTTTFGEDADYSINAPYYLLNGNGTVMDTVTALMWQHTDGGEMTIENAEHYCDTLSLAGYTDWRLPDSHELFSIFNHDRSNPALDTIYFTNNGAEYWWSKERQANDSSKVWVTNRGGGVGNHLKTETISAGGTKKYHVRAVRDIAPPPVLLNHFFDNFNGTTTDLATGLTWQQIPFADTLTWEQALTFADTLSLAGYNDWRIPNIKELQSINDERLISPSINNAFFSGITVNHYWSSTSLPNQTTKAWYLDTHYGITTYEFKTRKLYTLCVRGGSLISGLNENLNLKKVFSIFPNPSHGRVNVLCKNTIDNICVFDITGNKCFTAVPKVNFVEFQIDSPGFYFATIELEGRFYTRKLIIER
jgi:hypothetical protein